MSSWVIRKVLKKNYRETIRIGQNTGNCLFVILAEGSIGNLIESENRFHEAADIYNGILEKIGNQPLPVICGLYLGLARIHYQWNDLEKARYYGERGAQLARKFEKTIDRFILADLFLVQLALAEEDVHEASTLLDQIRIKVKQKSYERHFSATVVLQVELKIKLKDLEAAEKIARDHDLLLSQVKVLLIRGDSTKALTILEPIYREREKEISEYRKLEIQIYMAMVQFNQGQKEESFSLMEKILQVTQPEGIMRIFIDQGMIMYQLLTELSSKIISSDYIVLLLSNFSFANESISSQPLSEPLSPRELEVLDLLSQGLSNQEICDKLFLAMDTVKGHNRRIFRKLEVTSRTMAIHKARSLHIIP